MATFVFVSGAFHGGWCYDKIRPALESAGHDVLTPTLTGVGENAHLASLGVINLDTHIADIVALFRWHDLQDVILCGHSYGGMVITGVADQLADRISTLVYLDAALPKDGDSQFSLLPVVIAPFVANASEDGNLVKPLQAAQFGCAEEHHAWVDSRLTPHPIACFIQSIRLTGAYLSIAKRLLVYNTKDIGMPTPMPGWYEAERLTPGNHVYALDGGHDLMIDSATELAEILLEHA